MKKVYFACSIRGGREDADYYGELVQIIRKYATVLTEIFADKTLTAAFLTNLRAHRASS